MRRPVVALVLALAPLLGAAQSAPNPPTPPAQPSAPAQSPAPAQPSAPAQPPAAPPAAGTSRRVLSLDDAVRAARARAPALRQALSTAAAARARADQARAGLLPQLSGSGGFQRIWGEAGTFTGANTGTTTGGTTFPSTSAVGNVWSFSATANQLVYDFGGTTGAYSAARASADAQAATAAEALLSTVLAVRTAYFQARAAKDLVGVARATLANQEAHLAQTRAFVDLGTRPPIDLATARTNVANAQVQLVQAQNNYDTARARLRQVAGLEGPLDWDVGDERLPPVEGEDASADALLAEASRRRPDLLSAQRSVDAAGATVTSARAGYAPSLGVQAGAAERGGALNDLRWDVFAGATLTWSLFNGGRTTGQVAEARANESAAQAALDATRQQVALDIDTARLAVLAAKSSTAAAQDAVVNAREQLRLAQGRYRTGAGSAIELSDAQVAETNAEAQAVQADYQLATARAQLVAALGRDI